MAEGYACCYIASHDALRDPKQISDAASTFRREHLQRNKGKKQQKQYSSAAQRTLSELVKTVPPFGLHSSSMLAGMMKHRDKLRQEAGVRNAKKGWTTGNCQEAGVRKAKNGWKARICQEAGVRNAEKEWKTKLLLHGASLKEWKKGFPCIAYLVGAGQHGPPLRLAKVLHACGDEHVGQEPQAAQHDERVGFAVHDSALLLLDGAQYVRALDLLQNGAHRAVTPAKKAHPSLLDGSHRVVTKEPNAPVTSSRTGPIAP